MRKDFQTPQEIRQQIWKELGRASQDRHHAWRTPVLATVGKDGGVNARTVVLRSVDVACQTLQIFTDRRSPKVEEIVNEPKAMFVFWSARLSWQLRVRVCVANQTSGSQVEAHWQRVQQTAAAADYLGALAPGSPCPETFSACKLPQQDNNFTLLIAQVLEIDWLELGRAGHRRARLLQNTWEWLTP
jgi:general stress protein 26